MVLRFLDVPTLSLDGVLDVNLGDLVDFPQDPTNCKACTPPSEKTIRTRNSFVTTHRNLSLQMVEPIHDAVDSTCHSPLECR